MDPIEEPSADPTPDPTSDPITDPTADPTADPTQDPTSDPTNDPTTQIPSADPTADPTEDPSAAPSRIPTFSPSEDSDTDNDIDCCAKRCRKEWSTMSQDERDLYINGFKELADRGIAQLLSESHWLSADHGNVYFLPWHRMFIIIIEDAIRALGGKYSCFGMPYWYVMYIIIAIVIHKM